MKRAPIITTLTVVILTLALAACKNNIEPSPKDNAISPSISPILAITASPAPSDNASKMEDVYILSPFFTISPDETMRIEWVADENDTNVGKLVLVEIQNENTVIAYDYPLDTKFTAIWSEDSYYCALSYESNERTRTAILITKVGTPTTGQMIYAGELFKIDGSIQSEKAGEHIIPLEFADESKMLLSIKWIDKDGSDNYGTTLWDYKHGTYTKIQKRDN